MYTTQRQALGTYLRDAFDSVVALIVSYSTRGTANTMAASVIWVTGLWATSEFLQQLQIPGPRFLYAIALQSILTNCQGPIWHAAQRVGRRGAFVIGIAALLIDVGLNVGGLWIYLSNLGQTTFWLAIQAATSSTVPPSPLTCFLLSLAGAIIVAVGPEALWDL